MAAHWRETEDEMNISDMLIHVHQTLAPDARSSLEECLRDVPGVIAPGFSPEGREHLLLVVYDPEETCAQTLLHKVHEQGYEAVLVGL